MILKRFYDEKLAHASYLVGCPDAGEAIVIDPNRDADQYLHAAEDEGLKIVGVTETHIHADYLSGTRELSHRTGATMYLSDEGSADWKYGFAAEPNVKLNRDGDSFRVGAVRFDVVKTPGHTPEHVSFIVTDEKSGPMPMGAFTGDFIFVGDVGRPDLLERAANIKGTMEAGARVLHQSLQRFRGKYPDFMLLWPGHGSGSACGKSLGGVPVTTLGYEKAVNWALKEIELADFVTEVLTGQPDPPKYFAEMKKRNKAGPPLLSGIPPLSAGEDPAELRRALEAGHVVIDIRPEIEHAKNHFNGTLYIEQARSFTSWAGWLVPYDVPIYLISSSATAAQEAAHDLKMIGLDDVRAWFPPEMAMRGGLEQVGVPFAEPREVSQTTSTVLDVRSAAEYEEGHIAGAINIPLGHFRIDRLTEIPDRSVVVHCESGYRSSIAASILKNSGFEVSDIRGGLSAYIAAGLPIERLQPAATT